MRAKENPYALWDAEENTMAKGEEKAEILNAFFPSAFNSKTSRPQGTQPPEVEDWDKEQNEGPYPRETVTCCVTQTAPSPWDWMGSTHGD